MTLSPENVQRIAALGGSGTTLEELQFPKPLLFADWADYAEEDVFTALAADPSKASKLVTYPDLAWNVTRFTPFTPGTPDHEEWDGTIDAAPLTELCGVEAPTVVLLGYSDGFPNYYFTIAEGPNPENPAIYTTDHEDYFGEVEEFGTFSELLEGFLTPEEFEESVREALA